MNRYNLRYYQSDCIFSIYDYFTRKRGNPVAALPTGTGKGVIIAALIESILKQWPYQKIMMLTHVKELIEQNAEKLLSMWPTAPIGIYSAGLSSRDRMTSVIFGGIQSVAPAIKRANGSEHFGHRDLLLIDEAHLLGQNENSQYQNVIGELLKINPNMKTIGFTATPYRMKQGSIIDDGIFTDICYDITGFESFNRLIAEGFIAPLVTKKTKSEVDLSNVGLIGGEFNQKQLENATDKEELIYSACREICEYGYDRKAWLIFAPGVSSCEHIASVLQSFGISAACVHSKLKKEVNDKTIAEFKQGKLRCIVNYGKLTTGFDYPAIDLIGMLRATQSTGLWVQMLGRGTRPSWETGKTNCLVLDFAANSRRLGPINDPRIPRKAGKGTGECPVKICEGCGTYNHPSARVCDGCGMPFEFKSKLMNTASTIEVMKSDSPIVEYYDVKKVIYTLHSKKDKPPMIKVCYFCGLQMFVEYVMLEHGGLPSKKSRDWWRLRHREEPPATTYEALQRVSELRAPKRIRVWVNKHYPEILSAEF